MVWLSDVEKNFEYTFIRFERIHERDGRTDTHTQTLHDSMPRLHSVTRQKLTAVSNACGV